MKGQKSRAGHKIRPEIRDLIKKLPKRRGYRFQSVWPKPAVLNLGDLEKHFKDGSRISPEVLAAKNLIRKKSGKLPAVKILGGGKLTKKFEIQGCQISKSAKEAVEKAMGTTIKS